MAFNLLSQIMAYAVSPLKLIDSNPCKENIQRPKLRKKGIHIKVVAEIMGDSVETVMQNYAHIVEQMSSDSLELMSNIILNNQEKDSKPQNYNHTI